MFAHTRKLGPRAEYRHKQGRRVEASPTLAATYSKLKALTVSVGYYGPGATIPQRQLTYDVNIGFAKSVFRLACSNGDCVRGDHELTEELSKAIAKGSTKVEGEQCCQGWLSKDMIKKTKCNHVMHYTLKLAY